MRTAHNKYGPGSLFGVVDGRHRSVSGENVDMLIMHTYLLNIGHQN